jgi:hypothetical protein
MMLKDKEATLVIKPEDIGNRILIIRGHKVMLGMHLAELYGVETRALNQAVKRNMDRFPDDFMFQLTPAESDWLVSQNVIPHKKYYGGALPHAFTEQGVAMLSSVLKSKRAVQVNIEIMRAFVRLRKMLAGNKELARKLNALEKKYDLQFAEVFKAISELMQPVDVQKRKCIGFRVEEKKARWKAGR